MALKALKLRMWRRPLAALALVVGVAVVAVWLTHAAAPAGGQPTTPGSPLPGLTGLKSLDGNGGLQAFDLAAAGKDRHLVIYYWVAGHNISEDNLVAMQELPRDLDSVTLVSVVPPRGKTPEQVAARAAELGLQIPVIWDEGYKVQATVRAGSVPHITVVDAGGTIRVAGAASPRQNVTPGVTLEEYIERAAGGGEAPTITRLPRYYPVTELIGTRSPDFTLAEVPTNKPVRFYDKVADGKLTLLVFWSPDCGHCKKELPELNAYLQENRDKVNIVGITKKKDAGFRQRTADFIRLNDIQFPTVEDATEDVWNKYKIVTTPTTVVVSPDGEVETVLLGSSVNLEQELEPLFARLRKAASSGA